MVSQQVKSIQKSDDLIRRVLSGNGKAITEFYRLYFPFIKSTVRKLGFRYRANELESLSHDLCVKLYFSLAKYNSEKAPFQSWAYRLIKNTLIDYRRKEKAERLVLEINNDPDPPDIDKGINGQKCPNLTPIEKLIKDEEKKRLMKVLAQLSCINRRIIVGFYMEGKSLKEIALELGGISVNSVATRRHRLIKKLSKNNLT